MIRIRYAFGATFRNVNDLRNLDRVKFEWGVRQFSRRDCIEFSHMFCDLSAIGMMIKAYFVVLSRLQGIFKM